MWKRNHYQWILYPERFLPILFSWLADTEKCHTEFLFSYLTPFIRNWRSFSTINYTANYCRCQFTIHPFIVQKIHFLFYLYLFLPFIRQKGSNLSRRGHKHLICPFHQTAGICVLLSERRRDPFQEPSQTVWGFRTFFRGRKIRAPS